MEEIKYPIRINKYLAHKNICARREADEFILQRKVKINGRIAVLGDKVNEGDKVTVDAKKKLFYIAFNKPKNIITHSPQEGEKEIKDILKFKEEVFPIGRLDKNSSGLILLTNDGRLTDKLLNPEHNHEKEYVVRVSKRVDNSFLKRMGAGVRLEDGYMTKKCKVAQISDDRFSIVLTEGKKHQIRRMCDALGYGALDLERRRIMSVKLGTLASGDFRELKGKELSGLLRSVGLE